QPNPVATLRILGVSMSSAPYVGAAEQRRRRRYSVLSALAAEQYAPLDAEHISVMRDIDANEPFMEQVPYEWFQHVDGKSRVLVLWLDEHAIAFEPKHLLANLEQLVKRLQPPPESGCSTNNLLVASIGRIDPPMSSSVRIDYIGPQRTQDLNDMI